MDETADRTANEIENDTTKPRQIRIPDGAWAAYQQICERLGTTRAADINRYIREIVERHGTAKERALLAAADVEVAKRRARKGGRKPRTATTSTTDAVDGDIAPHNPTTPEVRAAAPVPPPANPTPDVQAQLLADLDPDLAAAIVEVLNKLSTEIGAGGGGILGRDCLATLYRARQLVHGSRSEERDARDLARDRAALTRLAHERLPALPIGPRLNNHAAGPAVHRLRDLARQHANTR